MLKINKYHPMKSARMQYHKVQTFLSHMQALPRMYCSKEFNKRAKRKFRKIKRTALKSYPHFKNDVYRAIYNTFELYKYTMYGGYYWPDLRPLLDVNHWPEKTNCRRWSLNGPKHYNTILKDEK